MSNYQIRAKRREARRKRKEAIKISLPFLAVFLVCIFLSKFTLTPEQVIAQSKEETKTIVHDIYIETDLPEEGEFVEEANSRITSADFLVTHYCGCSICCGKWSSGSESDAYGCKGDKLTPYISIAADPKIIPYGTKCWDEDGNQYIVQDVGGGIKGYHIDLFTGDHQKARKLGKKYRTLFWEYKK